MFNTAAPSLELDVNMLVFLNVEFTDLLHPELLSLALVTLDSLDQHYVELDLGSDIGKTPIETSGDFARATVLGMWGLVPGATCTASQMGRRTGEWLLELSDKCGTPVEIAFEDSTDYELMEQVIQDTGLWNRVREDVIPVNVAAITGTLEGELAAAASYRRTACRGLARHHSLADALALRAAYIQVTETATSLSRFVRTEGFRRLVGVLSDLADPAAPLGDAERWMRRWLISEAVALNRRRPIELAMEPGGIQQLERLLGAICAGSYL